MTGRADLKAELVQEMAALKKAVRDACVEIAQQAWLDTGEDVCLKIRDRIKELDVG